jgi:hypothetical protein
VLVAHCLKRDKSQPPLRSNAPSQGQQFRCQDTRATAASVSSILLSKTQSKHRMAPLIGYLNCSRSRSLPSRLSCAFFTLAPARRRPSRIPEICYLTNRRACEISRSPEIWRLHCLLGTVVEGKTMIVCVRSAEVAGVSGIRWSRP